MKTLNDHWVEYRSTFHPNENQKAMNEIELAFHTGVMAALTTHMAARLLPKREGVDVWEKFMDDATAASIASALKVLKQDGKRSSLEN